MWNVVQKHAGVLSADVRIFGTIDTCTEICERIDKYSLRIELEMVECYIEGGSRVLDIDTNYQVLVIYPLIFEIRAAGIICRPATCGLGLGRILFINTFVVTVMRTCWRSWCRCRCRAINVVAKCIDANVIRVDPVWT